MQDLIDQLIQFLNGLANMSADQKKEHHAEIGEAARYLADCLEDVELEERQNAE